MFGSQPRWHRIAGSTSLLPWHENDIAVVEAGGRRVCIGRYQGSYHAFAYSCPHASGIMANGFIDAKGNVVCPLHRYRFDLRNGRNTSGEGYYLRTYPLKVEEGGVFVQV